MNWGHLLTLGVTAGCALADSATAQTSLEPTPDSVIIRSSHDDGSGPSHLFARGRSLIVLDPNLAVAIRYPLDAGDKLVDRPQACSMPRNFSPRFVVPHAAGVRVIGEEQQPGSEPSNGRLPILELADSTPMVGFNRDSPTRPPSCGNVSIGPATIPAESRITTVGFAVSPIAGAAAPSKGGITVGPDPRTELFNARTVGDADGLGTAIIRREIVGGEFGRVNVAVWITLYLRGRPTSIWLKEHDVNGEGKIVGLIKRGFDYATVTGHSLFVMGTICPDSFCIRRFDLSTLNAGAGPQNNWVATVDLTKIGKPSKREDAPLAPLEKLNAVRELQLASAPGAKGWSDALVSAVSAYAFNSWSYPPERRRVPCGDDGPNQCRVRLRDGRLVSTAHQLSSDVFVPQEEDDPLDALWIGPRHLVDEGKAEPPNAERGIPYSFGGSTRADDFLAAIETPNGRPIGHIRESLGGVDPDNYPVGIDCSRFVWRIFGELLDTEDWIDKPPPVSDARFVKDLRTARPGDLIVKKGHIVIFNRRVPSGANLGVEVFEATSRCGRVCRSVYDADFFNGWRIMRLRQMAPKGRTPINNPYWPELLKTS